MRRWIFLGLGCLAVNSCAAAPVLHYTLAAPPQATASSALGRQPIVIVVDRVSLPDALDSDDMMVRHGNVLERSHSGRWASRLSLGVTDLVTALLARSRPDALVTDEPQMTPASYRISINISLLDLAVVAGAAGGSATLEADWLVVPGDASKPPLRDRAHVSISGPVGTDQDVAALTAVVLTQLAAQIDISKLR